MDLHQAVQNRSQALQASSAADLRGAIRGRRMARASRPGVPFRSLAALSRLRYNDVTGWQGRTGGTVFSSIADKTFHPEDMVVLDHAFRVACAALPAARDEGQPEVGRAAIERQIARLVVEIAQAGERSPSRLAALALRRP
jgi:hypothetical protein